MTIVQREIAFANKTQDVALEALDASRSDEDASHTRAVTDAMAIPILLKLLCSSRSAEVQECVSGSSTLLAVVRYDQEVERPIWRPHFQQILLAATAWHIEHNNRCRSRR